MCVLNFELCSEFRTSMWISGFDMNFGPCKFRAIIWISNFYNFGPPEISLARLTNNMGRGLSPWVELARNSTVPALFRLGQGRARRPECTPILGTWDISLLQPSISTVIMPCVTCKTCRFILVHVSVSYTSQSLNGWPATQRPSKSLLL
jgi:hypothetical protein